MKDVTPEELEKLARLPYWLLNLKLHGQPRRTFGEEVIRALNIFESMKDSECGVCGVETILPAKIFQKPYHPNPDKRGEMIGLCQYCYRNLAGD